MTTTEDIQTAKSIKNKANKENIIFTKADKGNTIIAIDKKEYIQKNVCNHGVFLNKIVIKYN